MTSKKVTRYYCDHCRKGGFKGPSMLKHEARCCRNAKRACGVCEKPDTDVVANAKVLIEKGLSDLQSVTDGCPACILAAHMMANKLEGHNYRARPDEDGYYDEFYYYDYKSAFKDWMAVKDNNSAIKSTYGY